MSVGGPQVPQGQQGIGHNDPVQSPGQDSGNIKTEKSLTKKIGHQLAKLLPGRAKKLFSGHRSVQALLPQNVEATPGLKGSSAKLSSVKPLSERNPQIVDVPPKLSGDKAALQQRRDSVLSLDSAFAEGDNLSIASGDSYASIRSNNSDNGYDSVKFDKSEFIDDEDGYKTIDEINKSPSHPQADLEDENQYDLPESVPDEPTISGKDVLARKFAAYEQLLDNDDFGALEKKLENTNNYQTAKKVVQLALQKQGKESLVFMIAQNRMQELKADQLVNELGGYQVGTDYNQIREQAAEMMDQNRYAKGYQARVLELVDQRLKEYETRFEGVTPFSHLDQYEDVQPLVPPKSEQLVEELNSPKLQKAKVEDDPPPLPARPETPSKSKKRARRNPGFMRRGR